MSTQAQPRPDDSLAPLRFDQRQASAFVYKSVSEETRASYRRVITEFFAHAGGVHPSLVTPEHVVAFRDALAARGRKPSTVAQKLSVIRSFFSYLQARGEVALNPASSKLVSSPALPESSAGRALSNREVRHLLAAPDRSTAEGARDYAMMLLMLRLSLRVTEVCGLRVSSITSQKDVWVLTSRVKRGRVEQWPLPPDVKLAVDDYLALDAARRRNAGSDREDSFLFQPTVNYRTLVFDRGLSQRHAQKLVAKWGEYSGVGKVTPHDLRRTIVTELLDRGYSYRDVQMVTKHRDPRTVQRYDRRRENLERNPVKTFNYD